MQAVSINTSGNHRAPVLFIPDYCSTYNMLRISLLLCVVPTAFSIIVKDPPPSPNDYKYFYDIQDPTTGDSKSQHEVRQGDIVTGAYTVVGADGIKRTVEYTADAKHGFKAVVSEEPTEVVTLPPVIHQPTITSFNYDFLKYHPSTARPYYDPVPQIQPQINFEEKPTVYFTPQNEIQPRWPINNGHYFIPAHDDKY